VTAVPGGRPGLDRVRTPSDTRRVAPDPTRPLSPVVRVSPTVYAELRRQAKRPGTTKGLRRLVDSARFTRVSAPDHTARSAAQTSST